MQGSESMLQTLNDFIGNEMVKVMQYETHHYHAEEALGLHKLGDIFHELAVEELEHIGKIAGHIHFLEGKPEISARGEIAVPGGEARAMVEVDMRAEYESIQRLNDGIRVCREENDGGSQLLLEDILKEAEEHAHKFETILRLMDRLGESYLATLT